MIREPRLPAAGEQAGQEPRSVLDMIAEPMPIHDVEWTEVGSGQDRLEALASIRIDLPIDNIEIRKEQHNVTHENYMKLALRTAGDREKMLAFLSDYHAFLRQDPDEISEEVILERARDGLTIWAPLAEICRDVGLKNKIEDRCFELLYPEERQAVIDTYADLGGEAAHREFLEVHQALIGEYVLAEIGTGGYSALVMGRGKTDYGVWRRCKKDGRKDYNLPDYLGLRILIDYKEDPSETDDELNDDEIKDREAHAKAACVKAADSMGLVSTLKEVPNRRKDYITRPKPNGYKSIHNTYWVDGYEGGAQLEVQIRTVRMHREAESGSRQSHMGYDASTKLTPGRRLRPKSEGVAIKPYEWRVKAAGVTDFTKFFSRSKFVFGGKGNLYELPIEATMLDFAFATHSEEAKKIEFVFDNTTDAPRALDSVAPDCGIVTYRKAQNIRCRESWSDYVVTKKAKREIARFKRRESRARNIAAGFNSLMKHYGPVFGETDIREVVAEFDDSDLSALTDRVSGYGIRARSVLDIVGLIGTRDLRPREMAKYILERTGGEWEKKLKPDRKRPVKAETHKLIADGVDLPVSRSGCCPEVTRKGTALFAYARRSGLVAHFSSCNNVANDNSAPTPCSWVERSS